MWKNEDNEQSHASFLDVRVYQTWAVDEVQNGYCPILSFLAKQAEAAENRMSAFG